MIEQIHPDRIPGIWGEIRALILKGLEYTYGDWEERDVLLALLAGQMQLWRCAEAVCITRILNYPRKSWCEFFIVAGVNREKWLSYEAVILQWARERGCVGGRQHGRKGWEKAAPEGWEVKFIEMQKEI